MVSLSPEAEQLLAYQNCPSLWLKHYIDIRPARYRSEDELRTFLAGRPDDEHEWCRRQLEAGKLTLDSSRSYQAEMLDAMALPGRYAFKCANGTAKTATAALFVHWFLDTHPGGKVVTTAGTWSQLAQQMWREIHSWAERAKQPIVAHGRMNKLSIDIAPDWVCFSRGADKAETFEGVHGKYIAVIVDEAKAVKPEIFGAVRRILRGNPQCQFWFVALSSPGSPSGAFYDMCHGAESERWRVFGLSAYESERIALHQIQEDVEDLGERSPLFIAMDLGEFPEEAESTVIPISWAQAAVGREVNDEGFPVLGIDVAWLGGDETVIAGMWGRRAELLQVYQGLDTVQTVGRVSQLWHDIHFSDVGIDTGGPGPGVYDPLAAMTTIDCGVHRVAFGSTSHPLTDRYANLKAYMLYSLRGELEDGFKDPQNPEAGISIPNDKRLIHQLCCQEFKLDLKGRYQIESHEAMKKRGEKSPDRADGVMIANYMRVRERSGRTDRRVMEANVEKAKKRGAGSSVLKAKF